jgi:prepilin-type N-terminal cleavage/methylation domain-containing protein
MKRRARTRKGFSLIELLVVVVLAGILFAVAWGISGNSARGNPERAAGMVVTTLRLARQHAIGARQWTLEVFPNRDGGPYADQDLDKCLRGFAVLAVVNNMDGADGAETAADAMQFEFLTEWKTLPAGVYFDDNPALKGNFIFGAPNGGQPTYAGVFQFPMDPAAPQVRVRPMGAVLFKPNGRAYVMHDNHPGGNYWQDVDGSRLYLTSAQYYEAAGGSLAGPTPIPGNTAIIRIRSKTGQVHIGEDD